jgi:N6-adenosine-specific RNA methylase IME4
MKYRIVQNGDYFYLRYGNKNIQSFGKNKELAERVLQLWQNQYDVIYADPPWRYDFSKVKNDAIESHYPTMSLEDICAMKIPAKKDSILYLWTTAPKNREGLLVMESWGFEYKTGLVWIKPTIGTGYHSRGKHELLLVGTMGNFHPPGAQSRYQSVINASKGKHSKKPDLVYNIIEEAYPPTEYKLLELFARNKRDGWLSWGNEFEGSK